MPYIKQFMREDSAKYPKSSGELNYAFTELINFYIRPGISYQTINDIVGALEGAKLEFYRRVVVPYETKKIEENGDVYEPDRV